MNLRHPSLLAAAACAMLAVPHAVRAADPAPPRVEIFSRGTPETTVSITTAELEKIKLEKPLVLADNLVVTHVGTGVFEADGKTGSTLFRATKEIPLKTGLSFGWLIRTQTTLRTVTVVESFKLPRQNGTWTVDPDTTKISDDGLTATTTDKHEVWDFLWRNWKLEERDPDGAHEFGIKIEDKDVAKLPFEIKKGAK